MDILLPTHCHLQGLQLILGHRLVLTSSVAHDGVGRQEQRVSQPWKMNLVKKNQYFGFNLIEWNYGSPWWFWATKAEGGPALEHKSCWQTDVHQIFRILADLLESVLWFMYRVQQRSPASSNYEDQDLSFLQQPSAAKVIILSSQTNFFWNVNFIYKISEMVLARVVSDNWDSIRWSHVLEAASNENQFYHTI